MTEPSQRFRVCVILLSLCGLLLAPFTFQQSALLRDGCEQILSQQSSIPVQNNGEETRRRTTGSAADTITQRVRHHRTAVRVAWLADRRPVWIRTDVRIPRLPSHRQPPPPRAPPSVC